MTIEQVAQVCHEAIRTYCRTLGDTSQDVWEWAPQWQKDSAIGGVMSVLINPEQTPKDQHDKWMQDKIGAGWKQGPVKDAEKKEHPCIMAYELLPEAQKAKDALFIGIVNALREQTIWSKNPAF